MMHAMLWKSLSCDDYCILHKGKLRLEVLINDFLFSLHYICAFKDSPLFSAQWQYRHLWALMPGTHMCFQMHGELCCVNANG